MAELQTEYVDVKNIRHKVEHFTTLKEEAERQGVIDELFRILTRSGVWGGGG